jgi:Tfp pilus assembly protein PilF
MNRFQTLPISLTCALLLLGGCERAAEQNTARQPDLAAITANNRGVGLMGRYDYEAARAVFAALSRDYPGEPEFSTNLAIALMNRQRDGDEDQAHALFQTLLAEGPENDRARYCAGLLEFRRGQLEDAANHFSEILRLDPEDAYAAYFLGQTLQQRDDHETALRWYRHAVDTDPYLRSGYYALSQLYRQRGQADMARQHIELYQKLAHNPRAQLIEFKYLRMGPKCEAIPITHTPDPVEPPDGLLFAAARASGVTLVPEDSRSTSPPNLTVTDINADGRPDLFVAGAGAEPGAANAVLLGQVDGSFVPETAHALVKVPGVNTALWGDYDNDGRVDVYLCRHGSNQLWRQAGPGDWVDVTAATRTANGDFDSVDGAIFDADHDGDLDIFVINRAAPNELLSNNLDGSFRTIATERGLDGGQNDSRSVLLLDLDRDRDTDLVVFNETPPHTVYINDLMWNYRVASGFDTLAATPVSAALAGDRDGDGQAEIYTLGPDGDLLRWQEGADGRWDGHRLGSITAGLQPQMELRDFNGDGQTELLVATAQGWAVHALPEYGLERVFDSEPERPLRAQASIVVDVGRGPSLAVLDADSALQLWPPGAGRHPFIGLTLSGLDDGAGSMRSNASGIGSLLALRAGSRWILTDTFRNHSGPGQGLQPVVVGLGGATQLDFAAVTWSDGVYQTELGLETGKLHTIVETQRQLSSCPVLFAWDGQRHAFVSDLLGVGGVGYFVEPDVYAPPRPWENFLLPEAALEPQQGQYVLKLGEPMEEAAYFDALRLVSYELPPGWDMVLDERMNISGPEPTGAPLFYREERLPQHATTADGHDVTSQVRTADLEAAPVGELDRRFIGRLLAPQHLTVEFAAAIDRPGARPVLVIDGWVEYPYSQTMFAAWQAQADYRAPTLEARGADGRWHTLLEQFGYPAGMPRRMALPLPDLPAGTDALRLTTNQEIYWDRIAVVFTESLPAARRTALPLQRAEVRESGFAQRTTGPQRQPHYDYARRNPAWDTRHMAGLYTAFGPAEALVREADDALAIIGPGEELHLEFSAQQPELPAGWKRRFVFETEGWAKDMDLYTADGNTLEPLPSRGRPDGQRKALHARYNTRYRSGI